MASSSVNRFDNRVFGLFNNLECFRPIFQIDVKQRHVRHEFAVINVLGTFYQVVSLDGKIEHLEGRYERY